MADKFAAQTAWLRGTTIGGLLRSSLQWPRTHPRTVGTVPEAVHDFVHRSCPRQMVDWLEDFESGLNVYEVNVPLFSSSGLINEIKVAAAGHSDALIPMRRGGYLIGADFVGGTALTASDTNYITFTLTNLLGAGSGTTAMLAATAANTTQATGGSSIVAGAIFPLTLNATAANLRIASGDTLQFAATVTGTLANVVDLPYIRLRFATLPTTLVPRIVRTAGSPLVGPVANTSNGEVIFQFSATNEVNVAGMDYGDQLPIQGNNPFVFEALVKVGTVTTAQRLFLGVGTAFNSTLTSISKYVAFKLNSAMTLTIASKDGTTTNTSVAPSNQLTLTANTYYWFRIDATDTSDVKFWVDGVRMRTTSKIDITGMASTDLMQPMLYMQKDSGTGTISATCDKMRALYQRA